MSAASALQFDLKPSLKLAGLLLVAHVFALGAAWVSLAGWALVLGGLGVLLSGAGCLAQALHRSSRAAVPLELRECGRASWPERTPPLPQSTLPHHHLPSPPPLLLP